MLGNGQHVKNPNLRGKAGMRQTVRSGLRIWFPKTKGNFVGPVSTLHMGKFCKIAC